MKTFLVALLSLTLTASYAEDAAETDPFDLSSLESKVEELGIFTKADVDAIEVEARALFNADDCQAAIPVLADYSQKSNWLANMIAASLDPYYGASYDERKDYPHSKLSALVPLETMANEYKTKRNIARAMEAECHMKLGDNDKAIPILLKTLDLLDISNEVWWQRTRKNLLSIIGVE